MKKVLFIISLLAFAITFDIHVKATDYGSIDSYDFEEVEKLIDTNLENKDIDFTGMVKELITGESENVFKNMFTNLKDNLLAEIYYNKDSIIKVIVIAIVAAFFTNLSSVFNSSQISETGFFITYMLLVTILVAAFTVITSIAYDMISVLLDFMKALIPAYFLSVGVASGSGSALAFYEITLVLISVVNYLFLYVLIPAINVYVVLLLINNVSKEDFLSKLADLLKTVIDWSLKTLLGIVLGVNVIQSLCVPIVDSLKTSALKKAINFIPGIGTGTNAITQLLIGSGALIKNGIGAAALVVIVLICLVPVLKLVIFCLMYQGTAAIVQPISDKRIVQCINSVFEGTRLILRVVVTSAILFIVTIAIVCMSTNATYFS